MAGCGSRRCNTGACGHDHSSKAVQSPSLVDITVVRGIFAQAAVNLTKRAKLCAAGEMTRKEFDDKMTELTEWLGETFCGHNRHFEDGPEDWNPAGLAASLRGILGKNAWDVPPEDDEEAVFTACAVFTSEVLKAVLSCIQEGDDVDDPKNLPPALDEFIETWAMVFAGATFGDAD